MSHVSGFPEWLPEQRMVELKWMDDIRRVFEGSILLAAITDERLLEIFVDQALRGKAKPAVA